MCSEYCTIEGDLGLPDLTLSAVKGDVMLFGCLHELEQVSVMPLRGMAVYTYIIMYGDYAREMVCCLVHAHLKDILGHLQTKWHVQETVPAMMSIKHSQLGRFLIEVYAPEAVFHVQLVEVGSTAELMRDFTEHRGFIMLSHNGLIKVLWVRHMHSVPSGLWGYVRDDTHSVGWEL